MTDDHLVDANKKARRGLLDYTMLRAMDAGWQADRIQPTQTYHCSAGCGRSYTCEEGDGVDSYLATVGYCCLDCRRKAKRWMAALRARQKSSLNTVKTAPSPSPDP